MIYQIAIDGPAGAGKSTIAKKVSEKLGFEYVDTGAMYRAITLKALKLEVDINNEEAFGFIDTTEIDFKNNEIYLDGLNVNNQIRSLEVSNNVSQVAKYEKVRQKLVKIQQDLANSKNVIMDGRDIGTVVLPNANLKIYLNASVEERAKRRMKERAQLSNQTQNLEETIKEIEERDYKDSTREISPLKKADDAIEIDTSSMSINEVIDQIISLFTKRGNSMEKLEQKDSKQTETDQVEETDQTPVRVEEKKTTKRTKKVKEENEEVKTEEILAEETIEEKPIEESEQKDESVDQIDLEEDVDHEEDHDVVESEDEEEDSEAEVRLVKPLQLVTGTVVRVFDAIDAQVDNFGNIMRKARDARVLIDLDNGLEGLLFPRDIYNYQGEDLHELFPIGKDLSFVIKKVYPDGGRVLLSTTLLKMREELSQFEQIVEETQIITAKVIKKLSIGLLLKYKEYSCLLPTSQIVKNVDPDDLIGKEIEVSPIRIDYNRIRLVVSQTVAYGKKAREEQLKYIETLEVGQVFDGVVKNIEKYGAFIQLAPGVEGLLHISEIAHERVFNIEKILKKGDEVKVQIINLGDNRIGLSRKSLIPNHWKDLITNLNIDDVVKPKVVEINNSGVVVEFEHGINGFLPKSEFAWERDVFIEDYVSIGDEIELKVIELDLSKKRIILSRKQLQENPWDKLNLRQNESIEVEVAKKLAEGFKVRFEGVMGYLPNVNIDQKKIAIEDIKEGAILQTRVRVFDSARTRLIVTTLERDPYASRQRESNYSKYMDSQESFTSTFGDLIADNRKKK